ncbi:uncharacterized protein CTRU02_207080 [Colletotrichum truncatum]|uniref:Uncharacterized protein n=1 Tax=Colletotrichum truncatum TaxID=5467 RepID=A0ACC3YZI5_COLTU
MRGKVDDSGQQPVPSCRASSGHCQRSPAYKNRLRVGNRSAASFWGRQKKKLMQVGPPPTIPKSTIASWSWIPLPGTTPPSLSPQKRALSVSLTHSLSPTPARPIVLPEEPEEPEERGGFDECV